MLSIIKLYYGMDQVLRKYVEGAMLLNVKIPTKKKIVMLGISYHGNVYDPKPSRTFGVIDADCS